jgi:hypothetical protein
VRLNRCACLCVSQGQVYSMAFANNTLFTAGQDSSIRVWNLNEQAGIFVSQVCSGSDRAGFRHMQSTISTHVQRWKSFQACVTVCLRNLVCWG